MKNLADEIIAGCEDAIAYLKGDKSRGVLTEYPIPSINVKAIRKKTGLTQEEFSGLFAIKTRTLQDWEQARRTPGTAARVFLALIDQHPATVRKTLKNLGYTIEKQPSKKSKIPSPTTKTKKHINDPSASKKRSIRLAGLSRRKATPTR